MAGLAATGGLAYALLAALAGANLLDNGGFEDTYAGVPDGWAAYVAPQEGAYARLDGPGHESPRCASLHTPLPYVQEPFNNWSQNVTRALDGETLELRGAIRTREATAGAMLWVQCWQRRPLRELVRISTHDDTPVRGTQDWQRVSATVAVPRDTDFVTVRAVLRGTGTAWFDDIALTRRADDAATAPKEDASGAETDREAAAGAAPRAEAADEVAASAADEAAATRIEDVAALGRTVDALRSENAALLREVNALRESLLGLSAALRAAGAPPLGEADPAAPPLALPPPPVPPLVPQGTDLGALLRGRATGDAEGR